MAETLPRYTRVHASCNDKDVEKLYPLLMEYLDHPEKADTVKEFIHRCPAKIAYHMGPVPMRQAYEEAEAARDLTCETKIRDALEWLQLGKEEDDWVQRISWMRPDLVAARKRIEQDESRQDEAYQLSGWWRSQDSLFAQCAATVLLLLCPNVEKLTYEDNYGPMTDVLRRNNYGKLGHQALKNLRQVQLLPLDDSIVNDPRFYVELDIIGACRLFHRLPSLETISASAVSPSNDGGYEDHIPPAISSVKFLHFQHVEVGSDVTGALIRMPRELQEFTLTHGGRATSSGGSYIKHVRTIAKALACQRNSLRKLDLDMDAQLWFRKPDLEEDRPDPDDVMDDDDDDDDDLSEQDERDSSGPMFIYQLDDTQDYQGTIGSLQGFHRLTHLSIGIRVLLGPPDQSKPPFKLVDMLPRDLESLLIRGYGKQRDPMYDREIEELLEMKSSLLPRLKEIQGIETCIPNGENVRYPDQNQDKLWKKEEVSADWIEVQELPVRGGRGTIAVSP